MTMTSTDPETETVVAPEEPKKLSFFKRLKQHPKWGPFYRPGVAIAGLLLVIASILTGPFPGPGGIPLFLLGVAVLGSEFSWAHRLNLKVIKLYHRYISWPKKQRATFWVCFFGVIGLFWYFSLLILGVPSWMPNFVNHYLTFLPGVKS